MKLFGRKPEGPGSAPKGDAPAIDLALLTREIEAHLPALETKEVEPQLVRARLADRLRDAGIEPVDPDWFEILCATLDAEAWRRLALLVATLDRDAVRALLPSLVARDGAERLVQEGVIAWAQGQALLTLGLLRESAARREEFARSWLAALGAAVAWETEAESAERLRRVDYGRLLAEAERAKQAAQQRVAELRRRQEEEMRRTARRSKW